ncbi:MAG TPA: hypothetical protein VL651_06500 [Bacteroidia bacterium]|nr:hypothetical protein [Bacteroidia bacterium]
MRRPPNGTSSRRAGAEVIEGETHFGSHAVASRRLKKSTLAMTRVRGKCARFA